MSLLALEQLGIGAEIGVGSFLERPLGEDRAIMHIGEEAAAWMRRSCRWFWVALLLLGPQFSHLQSGAPGRQDSTFPVI